MFEPSDAAESLAFAKLAYEVSEKFDTPVLLKMCTRVAHSQSVVEPSARQEVTPVPYEKNIAKFVMMPACAKARHPIGGAADTCFAGMVRDSRDQPHGRRFRPLHRSDRILDQLSVRQGSLRQPVSCSETRHGQSLPVEKIRAFAQSVARVIVVEELDGIIETHCRSIGVQNVSGKDLFGCTVSSARMILQKSLAWLSIPEAS